MKYFILLCLANVIATIGIAQVRILHGGDSAINIANTILLNAANGNAYVTGIADFGLLGDKHYSKSAILQIDRNNGVTNAKKYVNNYFQTGIDGTAGQIGHCLVPANIGNGFVLASRSIGEGDYSTGLANWNLELAFLKSDLSLQSPTSVYAYGGNGNEADNGDRICLQQINGGYTIECSTSSFDSGSHTPFDILFLRLNNVGDIMSSFICGGTGDEHVDAVCLNKDSTYTICGSTTSLTPNNKREVYLLKTDRDGQVSFFNTYDLPITIMPDGYYTEGSSIEQTPDGGYLVTANISSSTSNAGSGILFKTNPNGLISQTISNTWMYNVKLYPYSTSLSAVRQEANNSFIIAGGTQDIDDFHPGKAALIHAVFSIAGGLQVQSEAYGNIYDWFNDVQVLKDPITNTTPIGYLVAGGTYVNDSDCEMLVMSTNTALDVPSNSCITQTATPLNATPITGSVHVTTNTIASTQKSLSRQMVNPLEQNLKYTSCSITAIARPPAKKNHTQSLKHKFSNKLPL